MFSFPESKSGTTNKIFSFCVPDKKSVTPVVPAPAASTRRPRRGANLQQVNGKA